MTLVHIKLNRYRAASEEVEMGLQPYNVIVGRNDAGKSVLLKALDLFLNDTEALPEILNAYADSYECEIELWFEPGDSTINIDESVVTSWVSEELVSETGLLCIRKTWDTSKSKIKPDTFIFRKIYHNNDFLLSTEKDLLKLCKSMDIETVKANGAEYNNPEKRTKLRELFAENGETYYYDWSKLPTTGTGRGKLIYDALKSSLPKFEYFHADTPLSESDNAIQKYFKTVATNALQTAGIEDLEKKVTDAVQSVLARVTSKINQIVPQDQQVEPTVSFNWSNLVSTGFRTAGDDVSLPLSFRGDGFRRITMMSYFEYLAEEASENHQQIIFGFEEPETYLHPSAQEQLFHKLVAMTESGYQILVTTHSPVIVANSDKSKLVHATMNGRQYSIDDNVQDFKAIIDDLGITHSNQFIEEFQRARAIVLVEGIDDANALHYTARSYKESGILQYDFHDIGAVLVPAGGCDSVKHWHALNILDELEKPFYVVQDSDKPSEDAESPNELPLLNMDLRPEKDYWLLMKRTIENYIDAEYLRKISGDSSLNVNDFTDIKQLTRSHTAARALGGRKVCEKHFSSQSNEHLRRAFCRPDGSDEFEDIFSRIYAKASQSA